MDHHRLELELTESVERLRMLHKIDVALIAGQPPGTIAERVLPLVRDLLAVARVVVNLFDLAAGQVEWLAAVGRRRVHVGPGVRYSIQFMGDVEALRRGEHQLIDVHALPPGPEVEALLASGVHTYAVVPMLANGELIGALSFGGADAPLSSEQINIGRQIATQMAVGLMHAKLHEQLQTKAKELEFQTNELRQAKAELSESEARKSAMLEATLDCVVTIDHQSRIVDFNSAAERAFGYSRAEALGKDMAELIIPPAFRELHRTGLARYLATGAGSMLNRRVELTAIRKGGGEFPVELYIVPIKVGRSPLFTSYLRDITERRRAEALAREREEHIRLLLDSTAEAIYGIDTNGHCTFCNPACLRLLGYSDSSQLLGKDIHALIHHTRPDGKPYAVEDCCIYQAFRQGRGTHVDDEVLWRADGKSFAAEYWSYPVRREGQLVGAVVTFLDISDRKRLEAQFQQAQKMEAVGHLAGGVAHDFNNLLTIISGYSEILLPGLSPGDPKREMILQIRQAGERAAGLTRQLLAFSRQTVLEPKILDLNELVRENEKMLRRLIGEDVQLATNLDPALAPVKVDPGQIGQVIMNLAVNARDAMPTGGKLTIETGNVQLDETFVAMAPEAKPGRYVVLTATDTGIGMTPEIRAHVFEPFFTTKGPGKGTGLGLATVYGIVQQSSGFITVYSEPGRGTAFKIYFPAADGRVSTGKSFPGFTSLPRGAETILLVEDEDAVRSMVQLVLRQAGYTVLQASRGSGALRLAGEHVGPIHLLITDVVMPEMGGRELVERLARQRPDIKVLYLSGYTDDAVVRHGVLQAEVAFLQKPFTMAALTNKVREVLDAGG